MNIKSVGLIVLFCIPFSGYCIDSRTNAHQANCHGAQACHLSASGSLNLSSTNKLGKTKNIYFTLNDKVSGVLKLYHDRRNGSDFVRGEFVVDNKSTQPSHVRYKVVLKDNVGAVSQSKGDLLISKSHPKKMRLGSMRIPTNEIKKINAYSIIMDTAR